MTFPARVRGARLAPPGATWGHPGGPLAGTARGDPPMTFLARFVERAWRNPGPPGTTRCHPGARWLTPQEAIFR